MKLHEEFKLYENMWDEPSKKLKEWKAISNSNATTSIAVSPSTFVDIKDQLYNEVESAVEKCLSKLGLDKYCEDHYDDSYNNGTSKQYVLQWNFNQVPDITKAEKAINDTLAIINSNYGINIQAGFDEETLEEEGWVNLAVEYQFCD